MTTIAPPPVEYPMPYGKGAYVARIDGPHGRFGLDRDFLEGKTNKKAGRVTYRLTPGWYEVQDNPGRRVIVAVDSRGLVHELTHPGDTRDALRPLGKAAKRGETVDAPGAWQGSQCWCEAPATHHQAKDGRARCADHYKPADSEETPAPKPYDPTDETEPPDTVPAEWLEQEYAQ